MDSIESISDPAERALQALLAMEEARDRMEQLAQTRARAVHELYKQHGATKAARMLGISRVNLYRIIGQIPEVHQQRVTTAVNVTAFALMALGGITASESITAPDIAGSLEGG